MANVTVRIFAEWYALPLWAWTDGQRIEPAIESLGISDELISNFKAWNDRWMELAESDEDDEVWAATEEVILWNELGRRLAERLSEELRGRCNVVYYDYVIDADVAF